MNSGFVRFAAWMAAALAVNGCAGGAGVSPSGSGGSNAPQQSDQKLYGKPLSSVPPASASADSDAIFIGTVSHPVVAPNYCQRTGGTVERRRAEYGTNNQNPLPLASLADFCRYTARDGSRIYIFVSTLYTTGPTLAVLAYLARVPIGTCQGNPASCYCTLLGGSDQFGGTNLNGGGWVLKNSVDPVLEACIFPDLTSIDSWGLTYHSAGIIRGIDLSTVVRYLHPKA